MIPRRKGGERGGGGGGGGKKPLLMRSRERERMPDTDERDEQKSSTSLTLSTAFTRFPPSKALRAKVKNRRTSTLGTISCWIIKSPLSSYWFQTQRKNIVVFQTARSPGLRNPTLKMCLLLSAVESGEKKINVLLSAYFSQCVRSYVTHVYHLYGGRLL